MVMKSGVLSVDVEDGINLAMRDTLGQHIDPTERVVTNTELMLDLFAATNSKGTFFILGQVAEHYPQLVKRIHVEGHEIAVHGYDHFRFHLMDRETARDQLFRAKRLLEDLTGSAVIGHRAPAFSINQQTKWALDLLCELGFTYDSSIMPCKSLHYGWDGFSQDICEIRLTGGSTIMEFPMSVVSVMGKNVPCMGGSYFRLLPYFITRLAYKQISAKGRHPVFYIHPYEVDALPYPEYFMDLLHQKSLLTQLKVKSKWTFRKTVPGKMAAMINEFEFRRMDKILEQYKLQKNIKSVTID